MRLHASASSTAVQTRNSASNPRSAHQNEQRALRPKPTPYVFLQTACYSLSACIEYASLLPTDNTSTGAAAIIVRGQQKQIDAWRRGSGRLRPERCVLSKQSCGAAQVFVIPSGTETDRITVPAEARCRQVETCPVQAPKTTPSTQAKKF